MRLISLCCLASMLAGCAGEIDLRSASAQSAAILVQYRQGMTEFAARQTDLNRGIEQALAESDAATRAMRDEVDARVNSWEIERDAPAIARLAAASKVSAADILAEGTLLNPRKPPAATPTLKFDPDSVDSVVKKLTAVAKGRDTKQRATDLLDFSSGLRKAYRDAVDQASKEADAVKAETTQEAAKP